MQYSVMPARRLRGNGHWRALCLCAIVVIGAVSLGIASAAGSQEDRFLNVERLIESSTGARRVQSSSVPEALAKRSDARRFLDQARAAHSSGDATRANALLDDATRAMLAAIRLAAPADVLTDKASQDLDNQITSVQALVEALGRIGKEKNTNGATQKLLTQVQSMVSRAQDARSAGRVDEARSILSTAYDTSKKAIERLRGGETLVRSLHFNNKEEEYDYEIDRNDTHRMLVDVLAEEGRASNGAMVKRFLDEAKVLRKQAEGEAGAGDHHSAVRTLEQSTRALIRAIRGTGVYIPG